MKLASLDHFNLSPAKITLLALLTAAGVAFAAEEALGDVLGGVTVPVLFVIAALMFYIVVSTP